MNHLDNLAANVAAKPREELEKEYTDARTGLRSTEDDFYEVVAFSKHYRQNVTVAKFFFGKHSATQQAARQLAELTAELINKP